MKTADLFDQFGSEVTFCDLPLRRFGRKPAFAGEIQTVKCFEDNTVVRAELEKPGDGRILVVDGGASTRVALLGDILAALSIANGWAGLLINGAIRDSAEIDGMDQTVFALGVTPCKSAKENWGKVGCEIRFGGVVFKPGGFAYGDADGVLYAETPLYECDP